MRTGDTVHQLGLYTSDCCEAELIFFDGDRVADCPSCKHACSWELAEMLVTTEQLEAMDTAAA